MAGIVNSQHVQESRRVMSVLDRYIREETLKTIDARAARAQQTLKAAAQQYFDAAEQFRTDATAALEQDLAEYKEQQEAERDYLNELAEEEYEEEAEAANEEFIATVNEELYDPETEKLFIDTINKERGERQNPEQAQRTQNLLDIYNTVPALPVRAMNTLYPGKRIVQETGWNRFTNAIVKGWHYFVKWFKETGWRMLLEIGLEIILAFIPGIGAILSMVISTSAGIALDFLETCKTSAERVALQRAINEGKSRGLDMWDEMFMWRSLLVILMVTIADAEELTIDGRQLQALMLSRPVFMEYMKNDEFVKDMWKSEAKAMEMLAGEDPTTHEPDFQLCPENVDECRQVALDLLSEGRLRGFIASIPGNLKPFNDILK